MASGIEVRHGKACGKIEGRPCNCTPSYRAHLLDARTGKRIRKTFQRQAEAKRWRQDAVVALRNGNLAEAKPKTTLKEVCDDWFADARAGIVTTRSGDPFKPGAIRGYQQALRLRVYPTMQDRPFYAIRRVELQDLVSQLIAQGLAPASVGCAITPLRSVYARALQRGEIEHNPTAGIKLPAVRTRRERFATPEEGARLIAAAPLQDRAMWATAFYAGLRRGELMALRWADVDLTPQGSTIHVVRSWDVAEGEQETKNRRRRRVPIPTDLREHLLAHRLRQAPGITLVFGTDDNRPHNPGAITKRADTAWRAANAKIRHQAEEEGREATADELLHRITLHECRHTYASYCIAAGVNAKALCDYMGHSGIQVTFDRYGHLMPGNEAESATLLDDYFAAAAGR